MTRMRVVIATDSIGSLSSAQAGRVIAESWRGATAVVVPMGESGRGFAQAIADQTGTEVTLLAGADEHWGDRVATCVDSPEVLVVTLEPELSEPIRGIDYRGSSFDIGRAVRLAIETSAYRPRTIVVDLAGARTHDGGAGLLAGLGARADGPLDQGVAGLGQLDYVDLAPVRELLGDARLIGVVPAAEATQPLLGLRGITSLYGRAVNEDPATLLATDAALERLGALTNPQAAALPGAGACGGTAFAIAALGGRILTGPAGTAEFGHLDQAVRNSDLVVTGCAVFDFAGRGGGVLAEAARTAAEALRPCIVIAGEVLIGGREMRTMGVESAYAVRESSLDVPTGGDVTERELSETAARIARSWSW
jgi:glycerate kinase